MFDDGVKKDAWTSSLGVLYMLYVYISSNKGYI